MHNGTLTIKGDRVSKHKHEKDGYGRVERTHGSFYRRFSLPDSAASDNIQARSNNGVLELFIPRQEQVKAKKMGLIYITRRRYNKAKERGGKIAATPIDDTSAKSLIGFIDDHAAAGSTVCTDGSSAYESLSDMFNQYTHESVEHSIGEYVRGQAHTNDIESFWAMLKRGYQGTYHKMSKKHLARYVLEFAGRHNIRDLDTIAQKTVLARGMVDKSLPWQELTA